uniref:GPI transamidase component n=1 Tax=Panagrellus redivivus TaxID=6233 RepID=A0A7E4VLD8_PANRE
MIVAIKARIKDVDNRAFWSYIYYFSIVVFIGIPMWWITTSPHRSNLARVGKHDSVPLPMDVIISTQSNSGISVADTRAIFGGSSPEKFYDVLAASSAVADVLSGGYHGDDTKSYWEVQKTATFTNAFASSDHPLGPFATTTAKPFEARVSLVHSKEFAALGGHDACDAVITPNGNIVLKYEQIDRLEQVFDNVIIDDWLGLDKIRTMIDRVKDMNDVVRTTTPDVWNEIAIPAAYNIHVVFVHAHSNDRHWAEPIEQQISQDINRMINYLSDTLFFRLSTEHVWDLFDTKVFEEGKDGTSSFVGTSADLSNFITAVDQRVSPIVSSDPLLKFVFVLSENGLEIDGIQGPGQTFVSWGSIINAVPNAQENISNSIFESFQVLLGVRKLVDSTNSLCHRNVHPDVFIWNRFRRHAYLENLLKARHFILAINALAASVPQLVITEEVGSLVEDAKRLIAEAIETKNPLKAAAARLLAERAADHGSLLGTSDLTPFLKLGVYLPVCMPVMFPVVDVCVTSAFHYLKNRFRPESQNV